jgi:histidinol phosphatase-like enzyme (inositol monophosphatase family)
MPESVIPESSILEKLLRTAVEAAQAASIQILERFQQVDLKVEGKGDGSPVTIADKEAESTIRTHLGFNNVLGKLDILGEEEGLVGIGSRYRWVVDPIDGTRSFINRIPLFGTIIALEDTLKQQVLVGVIHLPVLGMTYAGARGLGCFCNEKPVRVASQTDLNNVMVSMGDPAQFTSAQFNDGYRRLQEFCPYLRGYADCFGHSLVIGGAVGAMCDPALNPWDVMATQVLIEEAGGVILLRPSALPNKVDALFGNRDLVEVLSRELDF